MNSRTVLAAYCDCWKEAYNETYAVTKKDAGIAKNIANKFPEGCSIQLAFQLYFSNMDYAPQRHPLGLFIIRMDYYTNLTKHLQNTGVVFNHHWQSPFADAALAELASRVDNVKDTLDWYLSNKDSKYLPLVATVTDFVQKYDKLLLMKGREQAEEVELTSAYKEEYGDILDYIAKKFASLGHPEVVTSQGFTEYCIIYLNKLDEKKTLCTRILKTPPKSVQDKININKARKFLNEHPTKLLAFIDHTCKSIESWRNWNGNMKAFVSNDLLDRYFYTTYQV